MNDSRSRHNSSEVIGGRLANRRLLARSFPTRHDQRNGCGSLAATSRNVGAWHNARRRTTTKAKAKTTKAKKTSTKNAVEGTITKLDPTQGVPKGKASKTAKPVDDRPRLDTKGLKVGDKLVVLSGTRCDWINPGNVVEFRGVERGTLIRVKHGSGKSTLVGSRNLKRQ
jgi:sRNA-binding protein